jgi:DNA polymerase
LLILLLNNTLLEPIHEWLIRMSGPLSEREKKHPKAAANLLADITNTLSYMANIGCRGFDCDTKRLTMVCNWGENPDTAVAETMEDIREDLGNCKRCGLSAGRSHIVFGEGDVNARLVFVGEGPGYEEDKRGLPFVGAAGQLLSKIIEAMHLTRNEVYICNIIKCRPPGNRNPQPREIEACKPFLERQLRVIRPEFICALGTFAAQTLLRTETPISKLRGEFFDFMGIKVLPTYHPAYLLRNPDKKRAVWEDMKKLMQQLDIQ